MSSRVKRYSSKMYYLSIYTNINMIEVIPKHKKTAKPLGSYIYSTMEYNGVV